MENPTYLGDAVYAYFDGNGIELKLDHHASRCLIYLEPEVVEALETFWARVHRTSAPDEGQSEQLNDLPAANMSGPYVNPID
jgi:hypothetical protein